MVDACIDDGNFPLFRPGRIRIEYIYFNRLPLLPNKSAAESRTGTGSLQTKLCDVIRKRMFRYSSLLCLAKSAVSLVFTEAGINAAFRGADIQVPARTRHSEYPHEESGSLTDCRRCWSFCGRRKVVRNPRRCLLYTSRCV